MNPHRSLTEPSLSPHYRKGREGKGREQEGNVCRDSQDQVQSVRAFAIGLGS